ncbi:hypothetical protein [Paracoccus litorisediminis]|uniref:Phage integrase family protein n=1 Tax=Paracoccus litorisediminis TaxID=2006130 RepID=A0A844HU75_9RHOB|nr:hypothetical protein [Paracoccus litorisediminis]MTH62628.1 hypothetical protein [Paracoccus litorisediminis]
MAQLPPTYRKSAKEKAMPLEDIIATAVARSAECSLAPDTVNRNLGFVGQLLNQARSEGIEIDARPDISDLREKDAEDAQEKVKSFTRDDARKIFEGTAWRGCANELQRSVPGQLMLCERTLLIPLIAAYIGARREEIPGLDCTDLIEEDGIWAFHLQTNELRRLKNKQSRRKVPIHEHLIELGLLAHRDRVGGGQLFTELKHRSARGVTVMRSLTVSHLHGFGPGT